MSSVDQRIVEMKFDNAQFERGIRTTLDSLSALDKGLKLDGASKGLSNLSNVAKNFSLGNIASGVDQIASRFSAMSVVAITALANITTKALQAGGQLLKSLTVEPIIGGLREYETNLNSIQTILSNTQSKGTTLDNVNAALEQLNAYSDQTIYNFAEMARNIGTFTAAGVELDTSVNAIKGIANLAAVSGSNSQQASTAMYQLSQALATGTVKLMDWNSVVNAGMGGQVFQDSLKETARAHGVAVDSIIDQEGSFRDSLQRGWLTSEILTETLSKFTGDLTAEQLKTMGYNEEQIKGILKLGQTAKDAATKVKTASQLIGTLQEAAGSGWAKTWQLIFGDFEQAKELFTNVNDVLGGFINASSDARNKVIGDWNALGGRTVIIEAIANAFNALIAVVKPIKDAFTQIFPPATGKQLYDLSVSIRNFTEGLKIGAGTADKLRRTFAGVFAIFSIGWEIIKQVASTFAELFGIATKGSGSFLDVTASVGDFLVALADAIKNGEKLTNFFDSLSSLLVKPINLLRNLGGLLSGLFNDLDVLDSSALGASLGELINSVNPLESLGKIISKAWGNIANVFKNVYKTARPAIDFMIDGFSKMVDVIQNLFTDINFDKIIKGLNTGLFAILVLSIKKFLGGFGEQDLGGGIVDTIKDALGGVTDTLSTMQNTLRAATLLQIAAALGILTLSIVALSKIDSGDLGKALGAMSAMFLQLAVAMAVLEKISSAGGFIRLPFIAAGLILLASAMVILTQAVENLSELDWDGLAKGLTGVTVLLGVMLATVKLMPPSSGLISTSLGLVVLAAAIKVLASAVEDLSGLSWEELAKGLVGVGGLLASLALFTKIAAVNKGAIAQGAGLVLLGVALKILASAMKDLGGLNWEEIGKGIVSMTGILTSLALFSRAAANPALILASAASLVVLGVALKILASAMKDISDLSWEELGKGMTGVAGGLLLIAAALTLMPASSLLSAAAIAVTAASLKLLADVLSDMGDMSWEEIGKSMTVLAGSLTLLALGLYAMTGSLPGSAALLVAAAALRMLAPVLLSFAGLSWEEIAKGLVMLAGVFGVFGIAGMLLAPVVPVLIGLGVAIALLGAGMLAGGVGLLAFSVGLTALAASGAAGAAAIVGIVRGLIGLIPELMTQIGKGIIAFAEVLVVSAPSIFKAMVVVMTALVDAIDRLSPKIINTLLKLLLLLLVTLNKYVPKMVDAGLRLVIGILNGIAKNISGVVTAATSVAVAFINGVAKNLPRIIQAGVNLILSFINGLATAIRNNSSAMGEAGANLGSAIVSGMVRGLGSGIGLIASKARAVASSALNAAKSVLGIKSPSKEFEKIGKFVNEGFVKGLDGNKGQVDAAFKSLKDQLSAAMKSATEDVKQAQARLEKLTSARKKDNKAIREARADLAQAKFEVKATSNAFGELTKNQDKNRVALTQLAGKYDALTPKIAEANKALVDAKKIRDDYNVSVRNQYNVLPDISGETKLQDYFASLKDQIASTQKFATAIQKLRDLGLNDEAYKQLLAKGPNALPFIEELLGSGKAGVDQINALGGSLQTVASSLGREAAISLYQAGVDAAAGLVAGLSKQQSAIEAQMDKIAAAMVKSIKTKLGIKSPSKVFTQLGLYSAEGLANGLDQGAKLSKVSAENIGRDTIFALQKSLSGLASLVDGDIDLSPTITPVLDLTSVRKDAQNLGTLLTAKPIRVDESYSLARGASVGYRNNRQALDEDLVPVAAPAQSVTYVQNNNSPKALSAAEIYRQTRNQLSVTKKG